MNKQEFSTGDRVSIIRHRHGWEDGAVTGTVSHVNHRSGGAAYYVVKGDDGHDYDIHSTKDLRAIH